jgi:hypothetical protein
MSIYVFKGNARNVLLWHVFCHRFWHKYWHIVWHIRSKCVSWYTFWQILWHVILTYFLPFFDKQKQQHDASSHDTFSDVFSIFLTRQCRRRNSELRKVNICTTFNSRIENKGLRRDEKIWEELRWVEKDLGRGERRGKEVGGEKRWEDVAIKAGKTRE